MKTTKKSQRLVELLKIFTVSMIFISIIVLTTTMAIGQESFKGKVLNMTMNEADSSYNFTMRNKRVALKDSVLKTPLGKFTLTLGVEYEDDIWNYHSIMEGNKCDIGLVLTDSSGLCIIGFKNFSIDIFFKRQ